MMSIKRLFVEKKKGYDIEAKALCRDLIDNLGLKELKEVRVINRYDIDGVTDEELERVLPCVYRRAAGGRGCTEKSLK